MKAFLSVIVVLMLMPIAVQATPLSIIESDFVTFSDQTQSKAWKIITRGDSSADYVVFAQGPELQGTDDGVQVAAQEGFKLESSIVKQTCSYTLSSDSNRPDFYDYRIVSQKGVWPWQLDDVVRNKCSKAELVWARGFGVYTVHCLFRDRVGVSGLVSEGRMDFSSKFTLTGPNGYNQVKQVASLGMESESDLPSTISFTDKGKTVAHVRWIGGAIYGEWCPGQDHLAAVQSNDNRWYTARELDYINYQLAYHTLEGKIDALENILISKKFVFVEPWLQAEDLALTNMITSVNTWRGKAMQIEYLITNNKPATFSGAQTILELSRDHLLFAPDFEITLNADWLKLVYMVGKPKITDIDYTTCIEGSKLNEVKVTVQNIGDARGNFIVDITCDSGIGISATARSLTLDPSESGTISIPFGISLVEDGSKKCSVTFSDSNNPANKDTGDIKMDCVAEKFCEPEGIKRCVGEVEQACMQGNWVETESDACKPTDVCNRDGICQSFRGESFETCGGKSHPMNDCATCNSDGVCDATETIYSCQVDCGIIPPKTIPTWAWIMGGIVLAVVLYFLIQGRGKTKNKRRRM